MNQKELLENVLLKQTPIHFHAVVQNLTTVFLEQLIISIMTMMMLFLNEYSLIDKDSFVFHERIFELLF